jgi:hypothetical protein
VPDFASIVNNVPVLLLTATMSGKPVLDPPKRLAFHSPLLSLWTNLCSKL